MRPLLTLTVLVSCLPAVASACAQRSGPAAAADSNHAARALTQFVGEMPATQRCAAYTIRQNLGFPPQTAVCSLQTADTVIYAYRTQEGRVIIRGREYYVEPERLKDVADSVQARLSALLGPGERCRPDHATTPEDWRDADEYVERWVRWAQRGSTTHLIVDSVIDDAHRTPSIRVEWQEGTRACFLSVGAPTVR